MVMYDMLCVCLTLDITEHTQTLRFFHNIQQLVHSPYTVSNIEELENVHSCVLYSSRQRVLKNIG